MAYIQQRNPIPKTGCGRRRVEEMDNPFKKKPCWDNYEMVGTKKKDGRTVPNCVPQKSPMKKADPRRTIGPGKNFNKANPTGTGADAGGGMTLKEVKQREEDGIVSYVPVSNMCNRCNSWFSNF
jgi:hypothetical protein